jgi:hypothetical protein
MNANRETDPEDERTHIRRAELLNAAIVPIPSNREASILAAKALAARLIDERAASPEADPEVAAAPAAAPPADAKVDSKYLVALAEAEALLA